MDNICEAAQCEKEKAPFYKGFCKECFEEFTYTQTRVHCSLCGKIRSWANKNICECGTKPWQFGEE